MGEACAVLGVLGGETPVNSQEPERCKSNHLYILLQEQLDIFHFVFHFHFDIIASKCHYVIMEKNTFVRGGICFRRKLFDDCIVVCINRNCKKKSSVS